MSFTYRGTNTANLEGVCVTPMSYISAGGLELDTVDTPGRDGRFYGGSRREATPAGYRITVSGDTQAQAVSRRDALLTLLDPARGPASLVPDDQVGWHYPQVSLAGEIEWEKFTVTSGGKTIYDGEVVFETSGDPSLQEINPTDLASPSSYSHSLGSTSAHPTFRITTISGVNPMVVTLGSFSVEIERFSGWTGNHVLVLDYEAMRFWLETASGARVASAVRHMSHFDRPTLMQGETYAISVTDDRPFRFLPNARKL